MGCYRSSLELCSQRLGPVFFDVLFWYALRGFGQLDEYSQTRSLFFARSSPHSVTDRFASHCGSAARGKCFRHMLTIDGYTESKGYSCPGSSSPRFARGDMKTADLFILKVCSEL